MANGINLKYLYTISEVREKSSCLRCGQPYKTSSNKDGWLIDVCDGFLEGFICPDCATEAEDLEGQIRTAMGELNSLPTLKVHIPVYMG